MIDKTAIVASSSEVGKDVRIGPYCIIEEGVRIGSGCVLASHVILRKGTVLSESVSVDSFVVLGGAPQSLGFDESIKSGVRVGVGTKIREGVTIHRGSEEGLSTEVGDNCFLMANSHVAHDCRVGNDVVITNGALLAGHVEVGNRAVLGGNAVFHQHTRIGAGVMVGGRAAIGFDIPPYLMVVERNEVHGLNFLGLKRAGYDLASISELKKVYAEIYGAPGSAQRKALLLKEEGDFKSELVELFLSFFEGRSKRGYIQWQQTAKGGGQ